MTKSSIPALCSPRRDFSLAIISGASAAPPAKYRRQREGANAHRRKGHVALYTFDNDSDGMSACNSAMR
jgi:predicted lipoprotein with Yx(FWY)xxD motif